MSSNPGQSAAQDQLDAQFAETSLSVGIGMALAAEDGVAKMGKMDEPGDQVVVNAFRAWIRQGAAADAVKSCVHDPLAGRETAHWVPWQPMLCCMACFNEIMRATTGTPQDRTCDGCGAYVPEPDPISMRSWIRQGIALESGTVCPAILIAYGLCGVCCDGHF